MASKNSVSFDDLVESKELQAVRFSINEQPHEELIDQFWHSNRFSSHHKCSQQTEWKVGKTRVVTEWGKGSTTAWSSVTAQDFSRLSTGSRVVLWQLDLLKLNMHHLIRWTPISVIVWSVDHLARHLRPPNLSTPRQALPCIPYVTLKDRFFRVVFLSSSSLTFFKAKLIDCTSKLNTSANLSTAIFIRAHCTLQCNKSILASVRCQLLSFREVSKNCKRFVSDI